MGMDPITTPENFETQKIVLKHILSNSTGAHGPLPPLVDEVSSFGVFLEKLLDYMRDLLNGFSFSFGGGDWGAVVKPLIFCVLAFLFIGLCYSIIKNMVLPRTQNRDVESFRKSLPLIEMLLAQLDSALKASQFSLAGRIRWKLFLFRTNKNETATPYEIFGFEKNETLSPFYELMFGGSETLKNYESFNQQLKTWEAASDGH